MPLKQFDQFEQTPQFDVRPATSTSSTQSNPKKFKKAMKSDLANDTSNNRKKNKLEYTSFKTTLENNPRLKLTAEELNIVFETYLFYSISNDADAAETAATLKAIFDTGKNRLKELTKATYKPTISFASFCVDWSTIHRLFLFRATLPLELKPDLTIITQSDIEKLREITQRFFANNKNLDKLENVAVDLRYLASKLSPKLCDSLFLLPICDSILTKMISLSVTSEKASQFVLWIFKKFGKSLFEVKNKYYGQYFFTLISTNPKLATSLLGVIDQHFASNETGGKARFLDDPFEWDNNNPKNTDLFLEATKTIEAHQNKDTFPQTLYDCAYFIQELIKAGVDPIGGANYWFRDLFQALLDGRKRIENMDPDLKKNIATVLRGIIEALSFKCRSFVFYRGSWYYSDEKKRRLFAIHEAANLFDPTLYSLLMEKAQVSSMPSDSPAVKQFARYLQLGTDPACKSFLQKTLILLPKNQVNTLALRLHYAIKFFDEDEFQTCLDAIPHLSPEDQSKIWETTSKGKNIFHYLSMRNNVPSDKLNTSAIFALLKEKLSPEEKFNALLRQKDKGNLTPLVFALFNDKTSFSPQIFIELLENGVLPTTKAELEQFGKKILSIPDPDLQSAMKILDALSKELTPEKFTTVISSLLVNALNGDLHLNERAIQYLSKYSTAIDFSQQFNYQYTYGENKVTSPYMNIISLLALRIGFNHSYTSENALTILTGAESQLKAQHPKTLKRLVNEKISPPGFAGMTPLLFLCRRNEFFVGRHEYSLMKKLLECGADPCAQNSDGDTFLHLLLKKAKDRPDLISVIEKAKERQDLISVIGFLTQKQRMKLVAIKNYKTNTNHPAKTVLDLLGEDEPSREIRAALLKNTSASQSSKTSERTRLLSYTDKPEQDVASTSTVGPRLPLLAPDSPLNSRARTTPSPEFPEHDDSANDSNNKGMMQRIIALHNTLKKHDGEYYVP